MDVKGTIAKIEGPFAEVIAIPDRNQGAAFLTVFREHNA
jgi:hypothetical protein